MPWGNGASTQKNLVLPNGNGANDIARIAVVNLTALLADMTHARIVRRYLQADIGAA
jgi:hypothetical protein